MRLSDEIAGFAAEDLRLRLLRGVLAAVEGSGDYVGSQGLQLADVQLPPVDGLDAVEAMAGPCIAHLDAGERYTGVATPARTALSLFDAHVDWATGINDLEVEHGRDAVIRLVGLGLVAEAVCEGDSDASAHQFLQTESGCAALAWFAAIEVVLAFASPDEPIDGNRLLDLLDDHLDEGVDAWSDLADQRSLARARIVVNNWTDWLGPVIAEASDRVPAIAAAVRDAFGRSELDADGLAEEALSVGVYRALTARHMGEHVHGPIGNERDETSSTVREALDAAHLSLERMHKQMDAAGQASMTTTLRVDAIAESADRLVATRKQTQSHLDALQHRRSERAGALGTEGSDRDHARRTRDAAVARLREARDALHSARTAVPAAVGPVEPAVVDALAVAQRAQLDAYTAVQKLRRKGVDFRRALSLNAAAACEEHRQHHESRLAEIVALRERIGAMRVNRRAMVRQRVSFAASTRALSDRLNASGAVLEQSNNHLRHAREGVALRAKSVRELELKQNKREIRCSDLRTRADESDTVVQSLSESIAQLRGSIEAVTARILKQIALNNEQRRLLRGEVQADLDATKERLTVVKAGLVPAKDAARQSAELLATLTPECSALQERLGALSTALDEQRQIRESTAEERERTAQLAIAAHGMLRSCAGRLDAAHAVLRGAQAAADTLMKEHRLRQDRLRTSDRAIQAARDREQAAQQAIEAATAMESELRSALSRNGTAMKAAVAAEAEARSLRMSAIRSEQESLRERIASLRELMDEAKDDRSGLVAAEAAITAQRVEAVRARESARARVDTLREHRRQKQRFMEQRSAKLSTGRDSLMDAESSLLGLRLTVDGSKRTRDRARASLAICRERLGLAGHAVRDAEAREARRVDAVADAQSWVDRTRTTIAALESAPVPRAKPSPPPVPDVARSVETAGSKLDHLLQKVSANPGHVEDVPDPSAAPNVDGVRTVVRRVFEPHDSSDDATQVVARAAPPDDPEAATEMFRPDDLRARLEAEDATMVVPKQRRLPPKKRNDDSD